MKKKISYASILVILIIDVLSVLAIRANAKPSLYVGLSFAAVGMFLAGLFSNRYISGLNSGVVMLIGYLVRINFPVQSNLSGEKLQKFIETNASYNEILGKYLILFILSFILLGFLSGLLGELLRQEKSALFSANKLAYMAIFIAISVVINSLRVGSVSFGGFPIILSGYLLGPIPGFIVGGVADLVGFIVRPAGNGFNPLFTLTSALTGLIPIAFTRLIKGKYPKYGFLRILAGIFVGQFLTSVVLSPLFSSILYGKSSFWVLAGKALIRQAVNIPVYSFLIGILVDRLSKIVDFSKFQVKPKTSETVNS